jgi:hypothetical protein
MPTCSSGVVAGKLDLSGVIDTRLPFWGRDEVDPGRRDFRVTGDGSTAGEFVVGMNCETRSCSPVVVEVVLVTTWCLALFPSLGEGCGREVQLVVVQVS